MLLVINIMPKSGIKKLLPENILIAPIKPPKDNDPVSPINTLAGDTLNKRYPASAPQRLKQICESAVLPPCKEIIMPKNRKNGKLAPAANPSNPSVRFTQLTVLKNAKAVSGITQPPNFQVLLKKGIFAVSAPER